jgi:hypothetical protein
MDPASIAVLTAGFTALNAFVTLLTDVWNKMPAAQQATSAVDVATSLHNVSAVLNTWGAKIDQLLGVKP